MISILGNNPIYRLSISLKPVDTQFVHYKQQDYEATRKTYGKAENINKGSSLISNQTAEIGNQICFYHILNCFNILS